MQATKKIFADFTDFSWRRSGKALEIHNEQEAIQHALKIRAICFNTYEVQTVHLNGKELTGEPENISARRYVGIDRILTPADVVADLQTLPPRSTHPELTKIFNETTQNMIASFQKRSADEAYIVVDRAGEYSLLKPDEKVFDRNGQQLWPKRQISAPIKAAQPKP